MPSENLIDRVLRGEVVDSPHFCPGAVAMSGPISTSPTARSWSASRFLVAELFDTEGEKRTDPAGVEPEA